MLKVDVLQFWESIAMDLVFPVVDASKANAGEAVVIGAIGAFLAFRDQQRFTAGEDARGQQRRKVDLIAGTLARPVFGFDAIRASHPDEWRAIHHDGGAIRVGVGDTPATRHWVAEGILNINRRQVPVVELVGNIAGDAAGFKCWVRDGFETINREAVV